MVDGGWSGGLTAAAAGRSRNREQREEESLAR
jgi:hypothetical protein